MTKTGPAGAPGRALLSPYHQLMEANTPPNHGFTPPPAAPSPPGAHQWPPHQPYPPTAPQPSRRPIWIIFAGIVIGCALIAGALFLALDRTDTGTPAASAPETNQAAASGDAASSSTCQAWKSTKAALDQSLSLPAGWDWDTPGIDQMIASRNAVITKAMNLFEPQITDNPPDVAAAARSYVDARRVEVQKFNDRTYTSADGVQGNVSVAQLNQLCGIAE